MSTTIKLSNEELKSAKSLMGFIDNSPTVYHATTELEKLLVSCGAEKLDLNQKWSLAPGILYYVVKDTSVAAFSVSESNIKNGFKIAAAHSDSPCFRIKPSGSKIDDKYERLCIEQYGSMTLLTWFDRPLALAGIVYAIKDGKKQEILIDTKEECLIIPSPAPHILRNINDGVKFSVQSEMSPMLCTSDGNEKNFMSYIASIAGVSKSDVLSFDLMPYELNRSTTVGLYKEFISAGRLDDLAMAHAIFNSLCNSYAENKKFESNVVAFAFDNEECGSRTTNGAESNFSHIILEKICDSCGLSYSDSLTAISNSTVISADMAQGFHPAYPTSYDSETKVYMNKGPALKVSARQSYSTSAKGSAFFKELCIKNDIPYQEFCTHSDMPSGGTIGKMLASNFAATTIDIGAAMLSMHSCRELCGSKDPYYSEKLFSSFFTK